MKEVECKTQLDLDAAIKAGNYAIVRSGEFRAYGSAQVRACGSAQVTACGSAQVTAYDSAQVRACDSAQVRACGSAQVRACDSAQVRACGSAQVTACDSAQVRACDSAQVTACDSAQVTATAYVAVTIHGTNVKAKGGVHIKIPKLKTAKQWCEFYGVKVVRGIATLFKALNDDFTSPHGMSYAPGTTPEAPDWDGGKAECGGGLHFSPRAFMAFRFHTEAKRFVACPVKLDDIAVHPNASMPDKVKARSCCGPVYEVDISDQPVKK